jgi:enoyl-[acyl-carrier protein] reductase II
MQEEPVKIVLTSGAVVNEAEVAQLKKDGFIVIHRDICPTVDSLRKAEACGVDVLIATGYEAGGHMSKHRVSSLSIFPNVGKKSQRKPWTHGEKSMSWSITRR